MHENEESPQAPPGNKIDRGSLIMAALLVLWAAGGFASGQFKGKVLPSLHGGPAWLMASAFLCGAALILLATLPESSQVVRSPLTKAARWLAVRVGWSLFAAAVVSQAYNSLVR